MREHNVDRFIGDVCPSPWHCVEQAILSSLPNNDHFLEFSKFFHVVIEALNIQKNVLFVNSDPVNYRFPDSFKKLYNIYCEVRQIKEENLNIIEPSHTIHEVGRFVIHKLISIFNCPSHGKVILPTELFIGALDNLQVECPLKMYWYLADCSV